MNREEFEASLKSKEPPSGIAFDHFIPTDHTNCKHPLSCQKNVLDDSGQMWFTSAFSIQPSR
jgi:hypothetical protein